MALEEKTPQARRCSGGLCDAGRSGLIPGRPRPILDRSRIEAAPGAPLGVRDDLFPPQ